MLKNCQQYAYYNGTQVINRLGDGFVCVRVFPKRQLLLFFVITAASTNYQGNHGDRPKDLQHRFSVKKGFVCLSVCVFCACFWCVSSCKRPSIVLLLPLCILLVATAVVYNFYGFQHTSRIRSGFSLRTNHGLSRPPTTHLEVGRR